MAKKTKPWKTVYTSEIRYHTKDYPYKISLEDRGNEIVIYHLYKSGEEWHVTHSIGLKRNDLSTMLKAIKKHAN